MLATAQRALRGSTFARMFFIDRIVGCTFRGVGVVCNSSQTLTTIARGLQRKIHPWIRTFRDRIRWIRRLRRSYIMGELVRRITGKAVSYNTYATDEEEQRYWKEAAHGLRELQSLDAKYAAKKTRGHLQSTDLPPLVMYYTPALPRYQRTKQERRRTPLSYRQELRHRHRMTPEIYIKWHWMTHPEGARLTEDIAIKKIEAASAEELREIYRLSKQLPDDHEVFHSTDLRSKKDIMATYNWRHFFSWYGAFKRREEDETEGQFVFDKKASPATWRPANDDGEREANLLDGHRRLSYGDDNPFDFGDNSYESCRDPSDDEHDSSDDLDNASVGACDVFSDNSDYRFNFSNDISGDAVGSLYDDDDTCDDSVDSTADETEEDLESQFADWTFSNVSIY